MRRLLVALAAVGAILGFSRAEAPVSKMQASTWQEPQRSVPPTDAMLLGRWDAFLNLASRATSNTLANAAKLEAMKVGAQLMDRGYCAPQHGSQWEKCRS